MRDHVILVGLSARSSSVYTLPMPSFNSPQGTTLVYMFLSVYSHLDSPPLYDQLFPPLCHTTERRALGSEGSLTEQWA